MRVTMLGTGTALPSPTRVQSGVLIEEGANSLLVDCGSGVSHRLAQTDAGYRDVDTVLLTHLHLDHIADLPTLLRAQTLSRGSGSAGDLKSRLLGSDRGFVVVGPPRARDVCERLFGIDDHEAGPEVRVEERDIDDFPIKLGGFRIRAVRTVHPIQCFAYRFGDELVISGDTAPTSAVLDLAHGVDTLIHECAYPDQTKTSGHTTPTELGRRLANVDVNRVVLTHLFPESEAEAESIAATVSEHTAAEVSVATDLTTFEVPS